MEDGTQSTLAKGASWTGAAFYALVAFEFFYMASPFAAYFYSVYGPGLNFFQSSQYGAPLVRFFLPHIVTETSSYWINIHTIAGAALTGAGFIVFAVGAVQIYYRKLTKKGAATAGLYRWIRHPQYAALILSGFGMLLLWPRYLFLYMFVTMVFVYLWLARLEERECVRKFGQSYLEYLHRTWMFFPFRIPARLKEFLPHATGWKRAVPGIASWMAAMLLSAVSARMVQEYAIDSLYARFAGNKAYVSLVQISPARMSIIIDLVQGSGDVTAALNTSSTDHSAYIYYILPKNLDVSELPMRHTNTGGHHFMNQQGQSNQYRIVIVRVNGAPGTALTGKDILRRVHQLTPVAEVWIDPDKRGVGNVSGPPAHMNYSGIPVPIY